MNTNVLAIIKHIIAANGERILADPARLKPLFLDLAKDEPKPLRAAFGRGLEAGAYMALKTAPGTAERAVRKAAITRRLRDDHGLDISFCAEALDILEAALYGTASAAQQSQFTPQPAPFQAPPVQRYQPPYQQPAPYQPQQINPQPQYQQPNPVYIVYPPPLPAASTRGMWVAVLVLNIVGLNWLSRFITGHTGTGILLLVFNFITGLTLAFGIGIIMLVPGLIIWIVDLVKICSKKWQMSDGTYLIP
jgi:hypothetical protein